MKIIPYTADLPENDDLGRPVFPYGAYSGVPEHLYRASPALAQSDLKAFADNPRKFLKSRTPRAVARMLAGPWKDDDTEARRVGRYLHKAIALPKHWLGYDRLPDGWALNDSHSRIKAWRTRHRKIPVRAKEFDAVEAMADALQDFEPLAGVLGSCTPELSIFWRDEATGLDMKARLDFYFPGRGIILDIKTTSAPEPEAFARDAERYGYWIQAAHYGRAAQSTGETPKDFLFAVVTKEDDPDCYLAHYREDAIAAGCEFLDGQAAALKATGNHVSELPEGVFELTLNRGYDCRTTEERGIEYERI